MHSVNSQLHNSQLPIKIARARRYSTFTCLREEARRSAGGDRSAADLRAAAPVPGWSYGRRRETSAGLPRVRVPRTRGPCRQAPRRSPPGGQVCPDVEPPGPPPRLSDPSLQTGSRGIPRVVAPSGGSSGGREAPRHVFPRISARGTGYLPCRGTLDLAGGPTWRSPPRPQSAPHPTAAPRGTAAQRETTGRCAEPSRPAARPTQSSPSGEASSE